MQLVLLLPFLQDVITFSKESRKFYISEMSKNENAFEGNTLVANILSDNIIFHHQYYNKSVIMMHVVLHIRIILLRTRHAAPSNDYQQ